MLKSILLTTIVTIAFACTKQKEICIIPEQTKINGASFVAARSAIDASHVSPILQTHANWVCLMPFALGDWNGTSLKFNEQNQWYGETEKGITEAIKLSEEQGLQVMVKPQVWFWGGNYTGKYELSNEQDWLEFEKNYEEFILIFARLSEANKIPLFCIGTEFSTFIDKRPQFWNSLITKVKLEYSGKLVYAANWDNYKKIPFWSDLDYIGIDAYFPLSNEKTPSVDSCKNAWVKHKNEIKSLSDQEKKQVLFTEYGYCSIDYAAKDSWNPTNTGKVNMQAQVNAYEALFETFWNEEWVAGGFFWKWFHNHSDTGGIAHKRFTPQNKPVVETIAKWYQ